jgi:hypothetical protein
MTARSPDVDAIIGAISDWRGATLVRLREIIHAADPEITEAAKWKKPSSPLGSAVFERDGIICIAVALKERVRLIFRDGASLPDPKKVFNAQLNGKTRAIDFYEGEKLDKPAIVALVRANVAHRMRAKQTKKSSSSREDKRR